MTGKKNLGRRVFELFNILILLFIMFLCVAPLLHVTFMSISEPGLVSTNTGIMLLPKGHLSINGYKLIFRNPNIIYGYMNTLIYVVVGTSLSAFLTIVAGYILSRKRFKYRGILMFIITFTMLFNGGLIPFFLTINMLGIVDTRWAVILPNALSVINIIIMRTAFVAVPDSLDESARLDGAGELTILFRVLLPLVKATFSVIILFYAVQRWNDWFFASIFIKKRSLFPLQLLLREILLQNQNATLNNTQILDDSLDLYKPLIKYATIMVSVIPILCVYPFIQKYFVKGVMIGSIKG